MTLKHKYIIARWAYSQGKPTMSDQEYNMLESLLKTSYVNDEELQQYFNRTWSDDPKPIELLKHYNISEFLDEEDGEDIAMYAKGESITSLTNIAELEQLANKFKTQLCILTPKINGWNARFEFIDGELQNIKSRSRENNNAMDLNSYKGPFKGLYDLTKVKEEKFTGTVFGELHLTLDNFTAMKQILPSKSLKSPVASVVTAIKSAPNFLTVEFFNIVESGKTFQNKLEKYKRIQELGLPHPKQEFAPGVILMQRAKEFKRDDYKYLTDGIVVDFPDGTIRAIRLFDYAATLYQSTVIGLEESFNGTNIGIKLLIEPVVTREGSTQRKIDIDNLARIQTYGITEGATVVFEKVSDTVEKIHPMTIELNKDKKGSTV